MARMMTCRFKMKTARQDLRALKRGKTNMRPFAFLFSRHQLKMERRFERKFRRAFWNIAAAAIRRGRKVTVSAGAGPDWV